jgi:hypothetical protein
MHRFSGMAAAAALALVAVPASAAQMTGAISDIDQTRKTFTIEDTVFTVSPTNTVGPNLTELQKGDEVEVFYGLSETEEAQPYNAMTISKVEDAGMADEVSGSIEEVDRGTNVIVVDGKPFAVSSDTRGTSLDELKAGDDVMLVYDTSTNDPVAVITLYKTN